jgi:peptide/nickel transport system permease protein
MTVAKFLVRRILELAATLLAASFLVFGSIYLAPGDPTTFLTGGHAISPQAVAAIRAQYHLNDPFFVQYGRWLGNVLTGDLGTSIQYHAPVRHLIESRLPGTLTLIGMALVLVIVFGIGLGWLGAVRGGATDSAVLTSTSVALGIPSFVAAIVMQSVFAVKLGWFPSGQPGSGFGGMLYHLTLPAIALSLYWIGVLSQVTRASMLEALSQEHVTVARSRGIPDRVVIRRHVFRNALAGIVTMSGLTISGLVITTVLVETSFNLGGVGDFLDTSTTLRDFPVVQAIALLVVGVFVVVNLIIDLCYPLIDPRVGLGTRGAS